MLFEVLYPVLAKPALPAADEPLHEVLRLFRHVCDMGWELKSLLGGEAVSGHVMRTFRKSAGTDTTGGRAGPAAEQGCLLLERSAHPR